jgi:hypothetical protein
MKKIFGFGVFLFLCIGSLKAQIRIGLKFGASSNNLLTQPIAIDGQHDYSDLSLALRNAHYGIHAGLFSQIKLAGFFIQPEILFNSTGADYNITELGQKPITIIKRESYQNLDIPVLMGIKLGPLQLGAGPVGHVHLQSTSELFDIQGYSQKFKEFTYGYQAMGALVIGKLYLDVRYEGNFSNLGDHFQFFGKSYAFDRSPTRIIGSIGIAF